jgi:hypothetical protein
VGIIAGAILGRNIGFDPDGPFGAVGGGPEVLTASVFGIAGLAASGAGLDALRTFYIMRLLLFPSGSNSTFTFCTPILRADPFLAAVLAASIPEMKRGNFPPGLESL